MKRVFTAVMGTFTFVACGGVTHSLGGEDDNARQGVMDGGAGGSTGGATATGGNATGGGKANPPGQCAGSCPSATAFLQTFPGCCTEAGECGINTDLAYQFTSSEGATHRLPGGCQPLHQPGRFSSRCPQLATPVNSLSGCCRPDNTCGYDFSSVNFGGSLPLGCVQQFVTSGAAGAEERLPADSCDFLGSDPDGG